MRKQYSDFTKGCILKCHKLMSNYLDGLVTDSDSIREVETRYWKMRFEVESMKVAVPVYIYKRIEDFMDTEIEPLINWNGNIFVQFTKDGHLAIKVADKYDKGEEAFAFCSTVMGIKNKLEDFAMRELYPVMVEEL